MPTCARLLLISHKSHLASTLQTLLAQVTAPYSLERRSPLDVPKARESWRLHYDVCLVDVADLPSMPTDPDMLAFLNQWQRELAMPIIVLTDDRALGEWAIQAGLDDYWLLPALTPETIGRSLRLLMRCHRGQTDPDNAPPFSLWQASTAFYQSLFDGHPYLVIGLDNYGRVIFANAKARQQLAWGRDYMGKTLTMLLEPGWGTQWQNDHHWILRTQKMIEQTENVLDPITGQLLTLDVLKRPLLTPTGEALGTQIVCREVTEQQNLQERLHLLQTLLGEIDEQSDFTEALRIILRRVCNATGWHYGEVWLPQWDEQEGTEILRLGKAWHCATPELIRFYEDSKTFAFLPGEGLPGRVWQSGLPEWITDVTQDDSLHHFWRRELARQLGLKGGLGVPLQVNGATIAIMVFFTRYLWINDPSLVAMVTAIAQQIGLVLARKQSEERRQKQQELLESLVDYLPVMVAAFDRHKHMQWINRHLEITLGWPLEAYQTEDIWSYCYPDPKVREQVLQHIQSADTRWHDLETRTKDGKRIDTTWVNIPLSDGSMVAIGQDITDRKQREKQLQRQADQLGILLNALPICIAYLDLNLRYQFVNRNYEVWFQKSPAEICGQSIDFILGQEIAQTVAPYLAKARQGEKSMYRVQLPSPNGGDRLVQTSLIPDWDNEGILHGIFLMAIELEEDGTPKLGFN